MKRFAQLNYDSFIIDGEVNEQLPLYTKNLENVYPLDGSHRNMYPDFYLSNGEVLIGDESQMFFKQNVSLSNKGMIFSGNEDSFIELSGELFNSKMFDIIINFNILNFEEDQIIISSDNLIIGFNANNKKLYIEFLDPKGSFSTVGDLSERKFSLCDEDSILKDDINNLTIHMFNKTILILMNGKKTKLLILKANIATDNIYVGKNFLGTIKDFGIRDTSYNESKNITISNNSTKSDFTLCFKLKKNSDNVNLLNIGDFTLKIQDDKLYANSILLSDILIEGNLYGIAIAYSQNEVKILIYNIDENILITNKTITMTIQSNEILTSNGIGIFNLAIFSTKLKDKILIEQFNKRFNLDKSGDIRYEINEIDGHNRLRVPVGEKYHMQLTQDLASDCKTISINKKADFVDGGVLSKDVQKPLTLSFADDINLMNSWNIIYKKCITNLMSGNHYDSLGEGLCWGVENDSFVIKYLDGDNVVSSTISELKAKDIMNEFIVISISYQSSIINLTLCCSKGIFETTLNKEIDNIGNDEYDLFLGGVDSLIYGESIYRELTIISNWNVSKEDLENMFRIKLSYENNKLKSNIDIIER